MKKLSKLSLLGEMDLLSKAELKQLLGQGNGCGSTQSTCSGSCGTSGNGTCGWISKSNRCACAEVYVGPIEFLGYEY